MDSGRFDALARRIGVALTRRGALATLLAGVVASALPGSAPPDWAAAAKRGRGNGTGKGRDKAARRQRRRRKQKKRPRVALPPGRCCNRGDCAPGPGKNLGHCCFQDQDLPAANFTGANLGGANFSRARLRAATFRGANLDRTCFVDADLTGARFGGTNTGTAIFCRTEFSDRVDDSGCGRGTPCCPTCDAAHPCGEDELCCDGRCVRGDCCDNGEQSTCGTGQICCGNRCVAGECCRGAECPNEVCCGNVCCPAGQVCDTRSNPDACCTPRTCQAGECGTVPDGCGGTIECGACSNPAPICSNSTCTACTSNDQCGANRVCCGGSCLTGVCCADADCAPSGNDCVDNRCRCGAGNACSGANPDCCGSPGSCTNRQNDRNNCGTCGRECPAFQRCLNGSCVCDVCPSGCRYDNLADAVNDAADGDTIRVCPGTFRTVNVLITKDLTIVGAGQGDDPETNTILDAEEDGRVLEIASGAEVVLRDVAITGGRVAGTSFPANGGGGIFNRGALTLLGVTVVRNSARQAAGILNFGGGTLTLGADTFVIGNTAFAGGGGIQNIGELTLQAESHVDNNNQTDRFSSGGGGIVVTGGGRVTLEQDSSVSGNGAATAGGGILVLDGTATLQAGSSVTRNVALDGGGVFEAPGTTANVADPSIVTNNSPNNCRPVGAIPNCVN